MNENELKKEFASLCWGISKNDNKWIFWWDLLENNNNYDIFNQKMTNLLEKLNEDDTLLLNMDTDDIYDMI